VVYSVKAGVAARRIHIIQVHDAYQRKALDQLPSAETSRPLAPAMRNWIDSFGETKHPISLETSLGYLEGAKANALISDLPHILQTLRVTLGRSHARSFNMLRTYDLRRTYSNWMEAAGILRTRRKLYMWHSAGDVTGGYELHEVSAFPAEDGKILRQFEGLEHTPAIRLEAKNA